MWFFCIDDRAINLSQVRPKREMIVLTLMSSMACETLILLMAASRLSWSTMMRCCCKLDSCREKDSDVITARAVVSRL